MSGIFGGGKVSKQAPEFASLIVQTSMWGRPLPITYGQTRLAGNLVWYGDFTSVPHTQSTGGKGGAGGEVTSYTYTAAAVLALCEGPVTAILQAWAGKNNTTPAGLNLTSFLGALGQAPWSYLTSNHASEAIGYSHVAYLASAAYDLGGSASLPNHNFEVRGPLYNTTGVSNVVDAALDQVLTDLLTNAFYGAGFPSSKLGSTAAMATYCRAHGIWVSPLYAEPEQAADMITRLAEIGNTALVFSEGVLKFIPYGDAALTGNGVTFTPVTTVLYTITDNDLLHSGDKNPVKIKRSSPADAYNSGRITFRDRSQDYALSPMEVKETDAIQKFGLRQAPNIDFKEICDPSAARMVAQLALQRSMFQRNTYRFQVGMKFCLLEPMDLVAVNEGSGTGLSGDIVRITSIEETADGLINIEAEDWLGTVHSAPLYDYQAAGGYSLNLMADPGSVAAPIIFDAPSQVTPLGFEVWIAVAGTNPFWGGCDVWVSTDDATYKKIGAVTARARYGALTGTFAAGSDPDTTNTCPVNLTVSQGTLTSATAANADKLATLCYAGNNGIGEFFSYQTATLGAVYNYTLQTYLRRGLYGSPNQAHVATDDFVRIDSAIAKYAYDPAQIGQTLYFKFTSKNIWGGAEQALGSVSTYAYSINGPQGTPATPTGMSATVGPSSVILNWTGVGTPNLFHYEIRQGASWGAGTFVAQSLTTQIKIPPQPAGTLTWWVKSIDKGGNYSTNAASASLTINVAPAPKLTALLVDNNVQLYWSAVMGTQTNLTYEVRKGASWATATIIGSKNGLFTTIIENIAGTYTYWVAAVDIGGNFGAAASIVASVAAPPDYTIALNANWPNEISPSDRSTLLTGVDTILTTGTTTWNAARGQHGWAAGQWYFEVHIDAANATNNIMIGIGTAAAVTNSYFGSTVEGYGYYGNTGGYYHSGSNTALGATFTAGDLIGVLVDATANTVTFYKNGAAQGSAVAITASKTWFPMVSLYTTPCQVSMNFGDNAPFVFPPGVTVNGMGSNAMWDHGAAVMPFDLTSTWSTHFSVPAWTDPQAQITAGFSAFGLKSLASGYFEQVFDCGTSLAAAKVTVNPNMAVGAGTPAFTVDIATSPDNSTYTNTTGVTSLFANTFRYVKVRVNVTSAGGDDLYLMQGLNVIVEVKIKADQGSISAVSTDTGGTTTTFNIPFLSVTSITVTPQGTTAIIPVVDFAGGLNPTTFKILAFNTSGTRVTATCRWEAKGY